MNKALTFVISLVFLAAIASSAQAACFGGACSGQQCSDGTDMTPVPNSNGSMGGDYSTPYQNPNSNQMPNQYQNPNTSPNQQNPGQQGSTQGANQSILTVTNNNNATLFSQLLQQTGMDQQLASDGPYTVFVPVDSAVKNVPQNVLQKVVQDKDSAVKTLNNMIVKGMVTKDNMNQGFQNLNGSQIAITKNGQDTFVNGQKIVGAQQFSNGAIYFIDGTILPQQVMQ